MLCPLLIYAQPLQVNTNLTDLELVQSIIGTGVIVSNISVTGAQNSYGQFQFGNMGMNNGVLLTTGNITNALGSNDFLNISTNNGTPGSDLLEAATGVPTYDACSISFDFVPTGTTLTFNYIFASEEYHEFVNSSYNDAMGLFISGPTLDDDTNIALVPGVNVPVSINNVNGGEPDDNPPGPDPNPDCAGGINASNPQFFVDNCEGDDIEYDGRTVPLTATITDLSPCETYSITLVIADVGDYEYDSGLFIQTGTFSSDGPAANNDVEFFFAHEDHTPDDEFSICEDVFLDGSASTLQTGTHYMRLAIVDPDDNPPMDPDNGVTVIAETSEQTPGDPTWLNVTQTFENHPTDPYNFQPGTIYQIKLGVYSAEQCWNFEYHQFTYTGGNDCEIDTDLNACDHEGKTGHISFNCMDPNASFNWDIPVGSTANISPSGSLLYGASVGTYYVTITDECGTTELDYEIESICCEPCVAPTNLNCYPHVGFLHIKWDEVPGIEEYEIVITLNDDDGECCSFGTPETLVPIVTAGVPVGDQLEYKYEFPNDIFCLSWYIRSLCGNGVKSEDSQKMCFSGNSCHPIGH